MRTDEEVQQILQHLGVNKQTPIDSEKYRKYEKAYKYAREMLEKECKQSCEALYHNLNTLESRAGSQVPFTSINIGRDTSTEGRLVTKCLLEASINGIGKFHRTSIFPISIFQLKAGVNKNPGDPNYDLKQLALKSMSMRIYPNFVNCDWSEAHEDENDIDTYFATMGALHEKEHLYVMIDDNEPIDITIKELFEKVKHTNSIQTEELPITNQAGIYKITYIPQDVSSVKGVKNIQQSICNDKKHIINNPVVQDNNINNYKFEVIEYTNDYQNRINYYTMRYPFIDINAFDKSYKTVDIDCGKQKPVFTQQNIPQTFIDTSGLNIKVLDKDNKWVKVNHIFKNDKFNTPLMMCITYTDGTTTNNICCTVDHPLWNGKEFIRTDELKVNDNIYQIDDTKLTITDISYCTEQYDSYDIGTVTGTFIGSDIIMHNCRTLIGYDRHGLGYRRVGRGNNVPNTIILPKIAIENGICLGTRKEPDLNGFWKDLDKALRICEQGLLERYAIIKKQSPKSAPFMYENHTMTPINDGDETVEESVKHNTLGIGLIGIAEMCKALFGKTHDEDEEVHKFALSVVDYISKYAKEASERNNLNFGTYFTPKLFVGAYTVMYNEKIA